MFSCKRSGWIKTLKSTLDVFNISIQRHRTPSYPVNPVLTQSLTFSNLLFDRTRCLRVLATLDRLALFNEASSERGRRFIKVNRYKAIIVIFATITVDVF